MNGFRSVGSSEESNGSVIAFHTADRFWKQDQRRMAELNESIRTTARCRFCDKRLADVATAHPGVCSRRPCLKLLRAERLASGERLSRCVSCGGRLPASCDSGFCRWCGQGKARAISTGK